jgi:hypothetical protein
MQQRLLWIVCLAALAAAQEPQPPPAAPVPEAAKKPKADGVLAGQVINANTKEPLRKASVSLTIMDGQVPPREKEVDAAGHFEFTNLEPGRFRIHANRNGFSSQAYGAKSPGDRQGATITLVPGQAIKDLVVPLSPHGVILGRVVDEDGEARVGIDVQAVRLEWQGRRKGPTTYGNAHTNDLGEYRIYGIPAGSYIIEATASRSAAVYSSPDPEISAKPEEGYVSTYYPGTVDAGTASPVNVRAGTEVRGIDIRMLKSRVIRIRGKILNGTTGKPARGFLMLMPRNRGYAGWSDMRQASVMDPSGVFEFKSVMPGSYTLITNANVGERQLGASQVIDAGDENILNLVVTVMPGGEIKGAVKIEGSGTVDLEVQNSAVMLGSRDADMDGGMGGGYGQLQEDGSFTMKDVRPGIYRVSCHMEGTYLKSAVFGDQDVTDSDLDLSQGIPAATLQLVLSKNPGEVTGTVQKEDGKPLSGATVVMFPDEKHRGMWEFTPNITTDQYGAFKFKSVRPGEYKVLAWEQLEGSAFLDPEFVKPFEKKAVTVSVKEGSHETLQLTVVSAEDAGREEEKRGL